KVFFFCCRTKWKRQTAVGLELLAEAGNYAAFQRLYGGPAAAAAAAAYGCWPYPGAAPASGDLYYRQAAAAAAAAATLQKPLAYRLYPPPPPVPGPSHVPPPGPAPPAYYPPPAVPRTPSPPLQQPPHSPADSKAESLDVEESPGSPDVDV
ncbi:hypothetical protein AAG570_011024, partial [Ranatra chinensis]